MDRQIKITNKDKSVTLTINATEYGMYAAQGWKEVKEAEAKTTASTTYSFNANK